MTKVEPETPAPARSTTRAETLRRSLEEMIMSGALKPGDRLDETELATRFEVSRTPVREALKSLLATGLVEMSGRQGLTVAAISIGTLLEMFQLMAELEGLHAKLAARRASLPQRERMIAAHEQLKKTLERGDPQLFYDVNREFHEAIYEASQSEFLADQTRALRRRVAPYRRYVTYQPGRMAATITEHQRILDAIMSADGEAAQRAARDHVNLLGDNLADFIASLPPEMTRKSA
ncbi:GntR family transcriptional regulator [Rhodopseudomonas palustris]|uniref:GntR family transcriptional regulator n=1 Tax=Rhodopseudomonas palustris TaxID=1076 RepID=A0A418V124_RHOPL|nr:GntR family transcriptional regulator [Rhodopseudomonas palustris]RJF69507.1 GntR family transcriptional regulator [Rhodopseudomonas palustris]